MTDPLVPEVVDSKKFFVDSEGKLRKLRKKYSISSSKKKTEPLPEGLIHTQAFEYYYALGDKRTLDQVAEKFDIAIGSARSWCSKFGWQKRVVDREREVASRLRYETEEETINRRKNVLAIIDGCISNKIVRDETGKITGVTGIDFKRVSELTEFLELAERILHPGGVIAATQKNGGKDKDKDGGGAKILINITK